MNTMHREYIFVDDNLDLLEVFKSYFDDFLAQKCVHFLRTPTEVLTHLETSSIEDIVMVLDYNLAGDDGMALVKKIRNSNNLNKNIIILLYSAILKVEDFCKLEDWGGIDWYIDKSRHDSLEQLRNFLEHPES
jgi:CheY-like chemotaxis protein